MASVSSITTIMMVVAALMAVTAFARINTLPQKAVGGFSNLSIGDMLERDYTVYTPMPTNASSALAQGWTQNTTCVPGLGEVWSQTSSGPTKKEPLVLYFTPYGQAAGVGVMVYGDVESNLVENGYFLPVAGQSSTYFISVSFRSAEDSCSKQSSSEELGDRLIINAGPGGIAESLPLTQAEAQTAGWVAGACFAGMGTHYFKDLTLNGTLSWEAANLLPVVTMYDDQSANATFDINAFFFASSVVQQSIIPPSANQWEPVPLPNVLMCKNFCSSDCTFHGTSFYSTLHIYLNSRRPDVTCNGGCSIGCC
eukprot:TRINITY_DN11032_c0_g1_i1.p1 TRINITY_DN11032_c0_g1~~TRINITY_DN11032_c0_g1_i1.p1  ORF type:complete len:324 (-),score=52.94 TRINITY_DN11032_c0_g1_i1:288-1217(-)